MTLTDSPSVAAIFEQAFGAPWRRGPIPTALDVLQVDLKRAGAWHSPKLPEPALRGGTETPLIWTRELDDLELARRYVIGFDKHAAYLGVLGGLELGIADPVRAWDDAAPHDRPGYWRVRCSFPPASSSWPDPLGRSPTKPIADKWITTPTLELALELGLEVDVLESWTWPTHRRVLRKFGDRCHNARTALQKHAVCAEGPRAPCECAETLTALKHVYAPILGGFLARTKDRERERRPPWYRPDWRHAIIAKARANLLRNLITWRPRGAAPIGIFNDAVYFASDDLGDALATRLGIPINDSLGGYTIGRAWPIDQVLHGRRLSFPLLFQHRG